MSEDEDSNRERDAAEALAELKRNFLGAMSAVGDAWTPIRDGIANIGPELAKIGDLFAEIGEALRRGEPVRWLGLIAAKQALAMPNLSEEEMRRLAETALRFNVRMDQITSSEGECDKGTALLAMLDLAVLVQKGSLDHGVVQKIADEVNQKRMELPNEVRKAQPLNDLIRRLRDELWSRTKSFVGNSRGTAERIFPALNEELAKLKIPRWASLNLKNGESKDAGVRARFQNQKKRMIDNIRKRIDRL